MMPGQLERSPIAIDRFAETPLILVDGSQVVDRRCLLLAAPPLAGMSIEILVMPPGFQGHSAHPRRVAEQVQRPEHVPVVHDAPGLVERRPCLLARRGPVAAVVVRFSRAQQAVDSEDSLRAGRTAAKVPLREVDQRSILDLSFDGLGELPRPSELVFTLALFAGPRAAGKPLVPELFDEGPCAQRVFRDQETEIAPTTERPGKRPVDVVDPLDEDRHDRHQNTPTDQE
jgi:hypothetical protein